MASRRNPRDASSENEVVELLHYDPDDASDEDEDFTDELPAGDPRVEAAGDEATGHERDGFGGHAPAALPQPERARSAPDLPKVKSSAFKRLLR